MKLVNTMLFLGGLAQLASCVIVADDDDTCTGVKCDDPGTDPGVGSFDVIWTADECPSGSATEVISLNQATGERFVDIYDCIAGGGATAALALGDYDVWLEVTSADGSQLLAQSNAVAASLSADGQVANVDIETFPINAGFFGLTWSLVDAGGNPLSCAEFGADGVDVIATLAGTSEATVDVFSCEDGQGVTSEVPVGTHTVVVDTLVGEAALNSSQPREETISFGNELVDLGNFDFIF